MDQQLQKLAGQQQHQEALSQAQVQYKLMKKTQEETKRLELHVKQLQRQELPSKQQQQIHLQQQQLHHQNQSSPTPPLTDTNHSLSLSDQFHPLPITIDTTPLHTPNNPIVNTTSAIEPLTITNTVVAGGNLYRQVSTQNFQ